MSRVIYSIETLIVNTVSVSGYAGSIHIRGIFFVVFIDADFNSCLWISKIAEFIVLVRVWWWWRCVCLGGRGDVKIWTFTGGGLPKSNKYEQGGREEFTFCSFFEKVIIECPPYIILLRPVCSLWCKYFLKWFISP